MKIGEFQEWANEMGIINPLQVDEMESIPGKTLEEEEGTGREIYIYVFPSGRVVRVYCDKENTIVDVRGDEEISLM